MNKTEIEYIKNRVNEIVLCTCGTITTKLNQKMKLDAYTFDEKLDMIRSKKAILLSNKKLKEGTEIYHPNKDVVLITCFSYPENKKHKEAKIFNEKIENKIEELIQEVHLEGKRIVDAIFLDIIKKTELPGALKNLGEMSELI